MQQFNLLQSDDFSLLLHLLCCFCCCYIKNTNSELPVICCFFSPPPAIQFASCKDRLLSCSLVNWLGFKGVLHKAAENTAGVCVSGVRAKFSKSSQCVSQWQHMLDCLRANSRTHNLTCTLQAHCRLYIFTVIVKQSVQTHTHTLYTGRAMHLYASTAGGRMHSVLVKYFQSKKKLKNVHASREKVHDLHLSVPDFADD